MTADKLTRMFIELQEYRKHNPGSRFPTDMWYEWKRTLRALGAREFKEITKC